MTAESSTQGAHASSASTGESFAGGSSLSVPPPAPRAAARGGLAAVVVAGSTSAAGVGLETAARCGLHTRRKRATAAMEESAAMMSAAQGPQRLETRNCASPKLDPATSAAGQVSLKPLPLATTQTR